MLDDIENNKINWEEFEGITVKGCTFCPYCDKEYTLSDHFRYNHQDVERVQKLKAMPKGPEKDAEYRRLKIWGNWRHNALVFAERIGILAVMTPQKDAKSSTDPRDYDFCRGCNGFFMAGAPLDRHQKTDRCVLPRSMGKLAFGKEDIRMLEMVGRCMLDEGRPGYQINKEELEFVEQNLLRTINDEFKKSLLRSDPLLVSFAFRQLKYFKPHMYNFR